MNDFLMIEVPINSDEKGYIDRKCHNEKCGFIFKVNMDDFQNIFKAEAQYCPLCRHMAHGDEWYTIEQEEAFMRIANEHAMAFLANVIDKTIAIAGGNDSFIAYQPGKQIIPQNIPIEQRDVWEQELQCSECGSRFCVVGSAFFCPCCGKNLVKLAFDNTIKTIDIRMNSLEGIRKAITDASNADDAEIFCRTLLENSIRDIVSAFQSYIEQCVTSVAPEKRIRGINFQVVKKGSEIIREVLGYGYEKWLTGDELRQMEIMFQRRHILEHNCGVVDKQYMDRSNDTTYQEGQRIIVSMDDIMELKEIVEKVINGINDALQQRR